MSVDAAVEVLEGADPDRLAALLLAPPDVRARLIALYALAAELARAPRSSGEPMLAEIRLQWWVEALGRLPDGAAQHPVLAAVAETWGDGAGALALLGEGQRPACHGDNLSSVDNALSWIDATSGELSWQAALVLGADGAAEAAVRAQGRALGVADALRRGMPVPDELKAAGIAAARAAAAARSSVPRDLAPVLYPGPARMSALRGAPSVSEFRRRAALLRFLIGRGWRFSRAS